MYILLTWNEGIDHNLPHWSNVVGRYYQCQSGVFIMACSPWETVLDIYMSDDIAYDLIYPHKPLHLVKTQNGFIWFPNSM